MSLTSTFSMDPTVANYISVIHIVP